MNNKLHILVTGGAGYIGSHTVVELILRGFRVSIIDNLNNSSIKVLDAIEKITNTKPAFYNFDLCDDVCFDLCCAVCCGICFGVCFDLC